MVANVTENSTDTVPRATIFGTGFTGLIYLAATVAALLLLPSAIAANSSAPFADAIAPILGPGAGALVAIIAAISAFGTCNALLLLSAEVGRSLAVAGDLPPLFRRTNAAGAPTGSILVGAAVATLLVFASSTESFVTVYVFIALVSTVASLVLYAVCAAAALKLKVMGGAVVVALLALLYARRDVLRRRARSDLVGSRPRARRPADPRLSRRFSSRCDQPGSGARSSRASGISRRSFCANERRHTSLVPSGPAT